VRHEVLHGVKEEKNILYTTKTRKANWVGHILRRNCLLKHIIVGKTAEIEVMRKQGRRRKQLLDKLKETKGYWKLKDDAQYGTLWRIRFGRDY
jgi:hypothetical protein